MYMYYSLHNLVLFITYETESLNQIFQMYGHDVGKPCPSLYFFILLNNILKSCYLKAGGVGQDHVGAIFADVRLRTTYILL